jgi:hypothetical protein
MENNKRTPAIRDLVRRSDIEPYTALKWLGTLFKSAAIFLGIAIVGEFMAGLRFEGVRSFSTLTGELARTVVLAVVLWGAGDMVRLLITLGHDIRAERILLARLVYRTPARPDEHMEDLETLPPHMPPAVLDPALRHQKEEAA